MNTNVPNYLQPVPLTTHMYSADINSQVTTVRRLHVDKSKYNEDTDETVRLSSQFKDEIKQTFSQNMQSSSDSYVIFMPESFYTERDTVHKQLNDRLQDNFFVPVNNERLLDIFRSNNIPPNNHYSLGSDRKSSGTSPRGDPTSQCGAGHVVPDEEVGVSDEDVEETDPMPLYPWMRSYYNGWYYVKCTCTCSVHPYIISRSLKLFCF